MGIRQRSLKYGALLALVGSCAASSFGAVIRVPQDQPTVAAACSVAQQDDEIVLAPGTYPPITVTGNRVTLRSSNPDDPAIVASTIIDGGGNTSTTGLTGNHSGGTVAGITIRRCGVGVKFNSPSASLTVSKCVVTENSPNGGIAPGLIQVLDSSITSNTKISATGAFGGGVENVFNVTGCFVAYNKVIAPTVGGGGISTVSGVYNSTITQNLAQGTVQATGGGLYNGNYINGCVVTDNRAIAPASACYGGGAAHFGPGLFRNTFARNFSSGDGGGVSDVYGAIASNVFAENTAGRNGGAIHDVPATVENCTIAYNNAYGESGAISDIRAAVTNCIIYDNQGIGDQVSSVTRPLACYIATSADAPTLPAPGFVNRTELDYRLTSGSPCIDNGENSLVALFYNDGDALCRIANGRVDQGAYEYNAGPDQDYDLLSDADELLITGLSSGGWDYDGDGRSDGIEFLLGSDPIVPDATTAPVVVTSAPFDLQRAIWGAYLDQEIVMTTGTYEGPILLSNSPVRIRSTNISDDVTIRDTVITAAGNAAIARTSFWLQTTSTISGITLADARNAVAIQTNILNLTPLTFKNCHFTRNTSSKRWLAEYGYILDLENCLLYNNASYAVAPYFTLQDAADVRAIVNCTWANNVGGPLYIREYAQNSIFWNNETNPRIPYGTGDIRNCIIKNYVGSAPNIITADPLFRDVANGNFRLRGASPARDVANGLAPTLDLDGKSRLGAPDLGAYEYQPSGQSITVSTTAINFGTAHVTTGTAGPSSVVIGNVGIANLGFPGDGVLIEGVNASDFVITNAPITGPVPAAGSTSVTIEFRPTGTGLRTASLVINHDDPEQPVKRVSLLGRGFDSTIGYLGLYTGAGPGLSTIGAGGDYPTLKAACDAVNATPLTSGDWVFEIVSDLNETAHSAIGQTLNGNRIIFRPGANLNPTITFNVAANPTPFFSHWAIGTRRTVDTTSGLGILYSTSGVTIDGCNTPGGTTRNLTITNAGTGRASLIGVYGNSDGTIVRNLNLINTYTASSSTFGVVINQVRYDALGYLNAIPDNTLVENNVVVNNTSGPGQAFWVGLETGSSLATTGSIGTIFRNNDVSARARGFFFSNAQEALVERNVIRVNQTSVGTNGFGFLATDLGSVMTGVHLVFNGNNLTQLNAQTNNAAGYGITGIELEYNGSGHVYDVVNNMIGGLKLVRNTPSSAGMLCGIRHTAQNDAVLNFYHNSISILGSDVVYTGLDSTNCMGIGVTGAGFNGVANFRNNVFRIAQPGGVAISRLGTSGTWNSDYNDMSAVAGAVISRFNTDVYPTLAQWQAVTGQDAHSRDIDPTVASVPFPGRWINPNPLASDLHWNAYPGNAYAGTPIPGVTTDIDGDPRDPSAPYRGADEFADTRAPLPDADGDGTADVVETLGGVTDGNNDGTLDVLQANVASVPSPITGQIVTVASAPGTTLTNLAIVANPSPTDVPAQVQFPIGFFTFRIEGVTSGSTTVVDIFLPAGVTAATYHKYAPRPGFPTPSWWALTPDGTTGAQRIGNILRLTLKDGARGDSDLVANGIITDPGAPTISNAGIRDWSMY